MMFSIVITAAPATQGALSAYRFACAALEAGNKIYRIFFYQEGVAIANCLMQPAQDELNLQLKWASLAKLHGFELAVCVASALRRGVLDDGEAQRYDKPASNLQTGFNIVGLGQLVDADLRSDRVVTFAG